MPKLTPVDHNPFAGGDLANMMGQSQSSGPASPVDTQSMGMMKWLIDQGHDPLDEKFDSLFGDVHEGPRPDNQSVAEMFKNDMTQAPRSFDPASIGAKLAPDGNHYLSDPQRAGKYLLMRN